MILRRLAEIIPCRLLAACCVLCLQSCGHSPTAPLTPIGRLVVHVSENGTLPAPGKTIEIVGTSRTQVTDANGLAEFTVAEGSYVVRAYDITTPGPPPPFVEKSVEVASSQTSQVEFVDCTMCR